MFTVTTPNGNKVSYKIPISTKPNPLPDVREKNVPIPEMLEINPPYNYNTHRPKPRKPSPEPTVTVKPIEQYSDEERLKLLTIEDKPVQWDLHYNRIHDKNKRKWYYELKTGDEKEPEKKKPKDNSWDTSKWRVSRLAQFMNANYWKMEKSL